MQTEDLLQRLAEECSFVYNEVEKLKHLETSVLTWRQDSASWNVLECLEHLNRYGLHYLPAIEAAIQNAGSAPKKNFTGGWLGQYFAKSMLPKEKLNKMKTFKDKNPLGTPLDKTVITTCLQQQVKMMALIEKSRAISLDVRVSTSLSSMLKLKLGDTYQFVINHNLRHIQQVRAILEEQRKGG